MKKIAIVFLAFALAGCANPLDPTAPSVLKGGTSITAPVDNPVTPQRFSQIRESLRLAMSGLVGYRRLCLAKAIPQDCRNTIEKIKPYTKLAQAEYKRLRTFVRQNDQINAIKVFGELRGLIADINAARGAT